MITLKDLKKQLTRPQAAPPATDAPAPQENLNRRALLACASFAKAIKVLARHARLAIGQHVSLTSQLDNKSRSLKENLVSGEDALKSAHEGAARAKLEMRVAVEQFQKELSAQINGLESYLEARLDKAREVLRLIDAIAMKTQIISFNAAIEAELHADKETGTFAFIAQEINNLSNETKAGSLEAKRFLDLKEFKESLRKFNASSSEQIRRMSEEVEEKIKEIDLVIGGVGTAFQRINSDSGAVFDFISSQEMALHALKKAENIEQISREVAEVLDGTQTFERLEASLKTCHIEVHEGNDLLQDILNRKVLRVGVDPTLTGISFRPVSGDPISGLDVDYVHAFAQKLGVEVQFVEAASAHLTELLESGPSAFEAPADLLWSSVRPFGAIRDAREIAFSESYTYSELVLAVKASEKDVKGLDDLQGKILACWNDPQTLHFLEAAGVRWPENSAKPGGKVLLSALHCYSDFAQIMAKLSDGLIDGFAVDKPLYYWACSSPASPWFNKLKQIESSGMKLWQYAVAAKAHPSRFTLLKAVNDFITGFRNQTERRKIELQWHGQIIESRMSYRDAGDRLLGADDIMPAKSHGKAA